uniref:Uncharacterized protein n=1 Tax=Tetradesmus obliquus TaxID=3088 RepID=A0A383VSG8_TETOB
MPRLTLRKVNAFTTGGVAATGNPAAVCLLDAALLGSMPDSLRQSIAADIGLSETAYVEPLDAASSPGPDVFKQLDTFRLRWFTPAAEVPLCGHATLASAATLFTECGNPAPTLHFHTLSGILSVTRQQHGQQQLLRMSLPLSTATDPLPPQLQPPASCSPAAAAAAAAGNADPADPSGDNAAAFSQLFAESPRLTELLYTALSALPSSAAAVPAAPDGAAAAADKAAWLSHVVQHVGYVAPLKYMLVALQPALQLGRQGLEALALDAVALEAAGSADYMGGLIVSTLPSTALQLGRQGLEALAPDAAALEAAGSADFMGGLIISTLPSKGGCEGMGTGGRGVNTAALAVAVSSCCELHAPHCYKFMLVALRPALQLGRQGLEVLAPDATALEAAGSSELMGGLIVSTLPSPGEAGGYDFHSRFFGPWLGVPEDPVTGSAHAVLAPYYAAVLRKQQLFARQCSARGGDVWMDAAAQPGRVLVSGEAAMEQTWEAEY